MKPILLTEYGETLVVTNLRSKESTIPISDVTYMGHHESDNGFVYAKPISKTHYVVWCAICGRIVIVPLEVNTASLLRQWCASEIERKKPQLE